MSGLIAAHSKDPAFSSFYNRISQRGSKMKAIIACAHKILRIIYKLLSTKQTYQKEGSIISVVGKTTVGIMEPILL